jgi:hypothetical protein
VHEVQ